MIKTAYTHNNFNHASQIYLQVVVSSPPPPAFWFMFMWTSQVVDWANIDSAHHVF